MSSSPCKWFRPPPTKDTYPFLTLSPPLFGLFFGLLLGSLFSCLLTSTTTLSVMFSQLLSASFFVSPPAEKYVPYPPGQFFSVSIRVPPLPPLNFIPLSSFLVRFSPLPLLVTIFFLFFADGFFQTKVVGKFGVISIYLSSPPLFDRPCPPPFPGLIHMTVCQPLVDLVPVLISVRPDPLPLNKAHPDMTIWHPWFLLVPCGQLF